MGDPTATEAGRLSLNPLKHLDPMGLLMLLAVGVGWAKPVPIDMRRLRMPRRDLILVSLAGPAGKYTSYATFNGSFSLLFDSRHKRSYVLFMRSLLVKKKNIVMSWLVVTAVLLSVVSVAAQEEEQFDPDLKYAQVRQVELRETGDRVYQVSVTLRHADSGWDHYADLWQIVDDATGEILGERRLAHPHTNEQPFTRSLSRVEIPEGVEVLRIRAKCNQHGYEGQQVRIPLDTAEGENYRIR